MHVNEKAGRPPRATAPRSRPFRIDVPDAVLGGIRRKLEAFDWDLLPQRPGWQAGTSPAALRALVEYWLSEYDWRRHERELNGFPQFSVDADGVDLHVLREPGSGSNPRTLVLLHGWPNSFATFRKVITRLAHPETVGGDPDDGVNVVVPSLPGYGFSSLPSGPLGFRSAGRLLHSVVTDVFGESRYLVHGGDQGAPVAEWMAFDHPDHCAGLHTTLVAVRHDGAPFGSGLTGATDPSPEETAFVERERDHSAGPAGAYLVLQIATPLTLAPALADSPAGLAAWSLEKFHLWSDRRNADDDWAIAKDDLITEIMIYLVTGSAARSLSAYAEFFSEPITLPPGRRIDVPATYASYPDPRVVPAPARFVQRSRNLVRYSELPRGGHFPALEVPDLFIEDLTEFVATTPR